MAFSSQWPTRLGGTSSYGTPLRGFPAASPESLAFGWGRRHITAVYCHFEGVVVVDNLVMVLALVVGKGLSRGYEVDYYLVHA